MKYRVDVWGYRPVYATVEVDAATPIEARERALAAARALALFAWEPEEGEPVESLDTENVTPLERGED